MTIGAGGGGVGGRELARALTWHARYQGARHPAASRRGFGFFSDRIERSSFCRVDRVGGALDNRPSVQSAVRSSLCGLRGACRLPLPVPPTGTAGDKVFRRDVASSALVLLAGTFRSFVRL